jgi:hypothetical protein
MRGPVALIAVASTLGCSPAVQPRGAWASASLERARSDAVGGARGRRLGPRPTTPPDRVAQPAVTAQAVSAAPPAETVEHRLREERARLLRADAPPRCPPEMSLVRSAVCVDRWEATLVEVLPGGEERPWSPHEVPRAVSVRLRAVTRPGVLPQAHISGAQAQRACEAAGKRLCTADEWAAACRGSENTRYPYGPTRRARACNDGGRPEHPVVELHRRLSLSSERMWWDGMSHPLLNQLERTVSPAGEHEACTNDYGVFDMVGNLHEWIEDDAGTFRGGYYMDTQINGEGCEYRTTAHSFDYHDYSTGFRCCLDADPVE